MGALDVPKTLGLAAAIVALVGAAWALARSVVGAIVHVSTAVTENTRATASLTTELGETNRTAKETQKESAGAINGIKDWLSDHETRIRVTEHTVAALTGDAPRPPRLRGPRK